MLCRQGRIILEELDMDQQRGIEDEAGTFCARVERVKF